MLDPPLGPPSRPAEIFIAHVWVLPNLILYKLVVLLYCALHEYNTTWYMHIQTWCLSCFFYIMCCMHAVSLPAACQDVFGVRNTLCQIDHSYWGKNPIFSFGATPLWIYLCIYLFFKKCQQNLYCHWCQAGARLYYSGIQTAVHVPVRELYWFLPDLISGF